MARGCGKQAGHGEAGLDFNCGHWWLLERRRAIYVASNGKKHDVMFQLQSHAA